MFPRIMLFALVQVEGFDNKKLYYKRVKKIQFAEHPLEYAGLMCQAIDLNIMAPVEIYFAFQDAKTGHVPESGSFNAEPLIEMLNEMGFYIVGFSDESPKG